MAFPPIQILRKREPPQSSDHRDHKRQHRGKLALLGKGNAQVIHGSRFANVM